MKDLNRKLIFAILVFIATPLVAQQQVYKVIDEDGNITYTDKPPHPDAKPMTLPGLSIISPQKNPGMRATTEGQAAFEDEEAEALDNLRELRKGYSDFAIVAPQNEESIWGTNNQASVAWDTKYLLQRGMKVVIFMDGQPQEPTTAPVMNFAQLDRGEHKVWAELRDARNRRVVTSDVVTFYIKQNSRLFPRQGGG